MGEPPGSIGWLYGDGVFGSAHCKAPGTRKALKEANEKPGEEGQKRLTRLRPFDLEQAGRSTSESVYLVAEVKG